MVKNCKKMTRQILTILLIAAGLSLSAQESIQPFKKANVIIVYTNDSDSVNFKQFARHLMKFDYTIKESDSEFLTISTKYHQLKTKSGWNYNYSYDIFFNEGQVIIKIHWILGLTVELYGVKVY